MNKKQVFGFVVIFLLIVAFVIIAVVTNNKGSEPVVVTTDMDTNLVTPTPTKYDTTLTTKYIHAQDAWPPVVQLNSGTFVCAPNDRKQIADKTYCITSTNDGAAGSVYTTYNYVTEINSQLASANFTLKSVQCGNYDEPQKTECETERNTLDLDGLVDKVIQNSL